METAISRLKERVHAIMAKSRSCQGAMFAIVLTLVVAQAAGSAWARETAELL